MGNLALHSAEEPDNLRATTGTVEVPTKRDNNVALAPRARPIQQHENAARHTTSMSRAISFPKFHLFCRGSPLVIITKKNNQMEIMKVKVQYFL